MSGNAWFEGYTYENLLLLGGSHHGERMNLPTYLNEVVIPIVEPQYAKFENSFDSAPMLGIDKEIYVRQKILIPLGHVHLFVAQKELSQMDYLVSDMVSKTLGANPVEKNNLTAKHLDKSALDILNQHPLPKLAKPVVEEKPKEGLTIVIGDRTVHWDADAPQLAGILSWATQSLGPGHEK